MKLLYVDAFSGISGDMLLGGLLDLGVSRASVSRDLRGLGLPPWRWSIRRVRRGAFRALHVVVTSRSARSRIRIRDVMRRARRAGLPDGVARTGGQILAGLLAAEGRVHGTPPKHVHLHEVEDLDTAVDVYGSLLALRRLGVERVYASPISTGSGLVRTRHGELPVPAPGTAELLRGIPVALGAGQGELATPTGAAILAGILNRGPVPVMTIDRIGYGAGAGTGGERPNFLRLMLGRSVEARSTDEVCQIETVVDDMSPQLLEAFMERAYATGALEAWSCPASLKRQRSGWTITALCPVERREAVTAAFFRETSTLGVRVSLVNRAVLPRRTVSVKTRWGPIRYKVAGSGAELHAAPEYRDVRAAARSFGVSHRVVLADAQARWREACARVGGRRGGRRSG